MSHVPITTGNTVEIEGITYTELRMWGVPSKAFKEAARMLRRHKCEYITEPIRRWYCPLTELDSLLSELAPFLLKASKEQAEQSARVAHQLAGGING